MQSFQSFLEKKTINEAMSYLVIEQQENPEYFKMFTDFYPKILESINEGMFDWFKSKSPYGDMVNNKPNPFPAQKPVSNKPVSNKPTQPPVYNMVHSDESQIGKDASTSSKIADQAIQKLLQTVKNVAKQIGTQQGQNLSGFVDQFADNWKTFKRNVSTSLIGTKFLKDQDKHLSNLTSKNTTNNNPVSNNTQSYINNNMNSPQSYVATSNTANAYPSYADPQFASQRYS